MRIPGRLGVREALWEFYRWRTVPVRRAWPNWFANRLLPYEWISRERWIEWKRSDTIFVFGSGPSVNELTERQWEIVQAHDSIGLNFAFLAKRPMTYFYLGYEPSSNDSLRQAFSPEVRALYEDTLWFVPSKVLWRLVHPRTAPEFFPPRPKLALFEYPPVITLESDRPFQPLDFETSLVYRGVMGIGLQLVSWLGYRRIVLVGVDLHTYKHFFDDHEVMRTDRQRYNQKMAPGKVFEAMIPKKGRYRTMEEYYHAASELYFRPRGIELYVSNRKNMLNPRIPQYPEFAIIPKGEHHELV